MAVAELRVTQKLNEYEFGVQVKILRSGPNKNKWDYQNIDKYYLTFAGQPLLCAYVNGQVLDGHNMSERVDANGETYYSFMDGTAERIVGTLSDDPNDFKLVEEDGETWIVAEGRLFQFYARELVEEIVAQKVISVSAETEVFDSYMEGDIEVFTRWAGLGVTLLHNTVPPAIPGANIKALQALESEFKAACLKAASYRSQSEDETSTESDDIGDEPEDVDEVEEEEKEEDDISDESDDLDEDDTDTTQKAANTKINKGVNDMQVLSKRQVMDIAPQFEGYTVVGAGQDDNGYHFCLMSADGMTAAYSMDSLDEVIDPKKITKFGAKVSYAFDEASIDVELDALTDGLVSSVKHSSAAVESLTSELATANATIEAMKSAEAKRRLSAAKTAAKTTLDRFNENREEKVNADVLDCINEKIDAGEYSECENADGEWCGEEKVCSDVLAKCAEKVMEFDKAHVARNSKHYIWDSRSDSEPAVDDVAALINKWKTMSI